MDHLRYPPESYCMPLCKVIDERVRLHYGSLPWNIFVSYRNAWDALKIVAAAEGCVAARLLNGKLAQPLRRYL